MNTINRLTHNNQNKIKYKHSFITETNDRNTTADRNRIIDHSLVKTQSCGSFTKTAENIIYSNTKLKNKIEIKEKELLNNIKSNSLNDITKDHTADMSPYLSTVGQNMTFINDSF